MGEAQFEGYAEGAIELSCGEEALGGVFSIS